MKKKFSSKAVRKMKADAEKGRWYALVRLEDIPDFLRWLSEHEWIGQSPDVGEALRAYKYGWTIRVYYDGHRTCCERLAMALWLTYECFKD